MLNNSANRPVDFVRKCYSLLLLLALFCILLLLYLTKIADIPGLKVLRSLGNLCPERTKEQEELFRALQEIKARPYKFGIVLGQNGKVLQPSENPESFAKEIFENKQTPTSQMSYNIIIPSLHVAVSSNKDQQFSKRFSPPKFRTNNFDEHLYPEPRILDDTRNRSYTDLYGNMLEIRPNRFRVEDSLVRAEIKAETEANSGESDSVTKQPIMPTRITEPEYDDVSPVASEQSIHPRGPSIVNKISEHQVFDPYRKVLGDENSAISDYSSAYQHFIRAWCIQRDYRINWERILQSCQHALEWNSNKPYWTIHNVTSAGMSYISFIDIRPVGQFSRFMIQSVAHDGTEKRTGGDFWRVHVKGASSVPVTFVDHNNGTYEILFLVMEDGRYTAEIFLDYTLCDGMKDPPSNWFVNGKRIIIKLTQGKLNFEIYFSRKALFFEQ